MCDDNVAILSSNGDMTSFSYGDTTIRFKTSKSLVRYTSVKRWDAGYIECDAIYRDLEEPVEEYIDLVPILENLYFRPSEFLKDIREVIVRYDR